MFFTCSSCFSAAKVLDIDYFQDSAGNLPLVLESCETGAKQMELRLVSLLRANLMEAPVKALMMTSGTVGM